MPFIWPIIPLWAPSWPNKPSGKEILKVTTEDRLRSSWDLVKIKDVEKLEDVKRPIHYRLIYIYWLIDKSEK